jgi:molybdopterin converting factor subunit 1
MKVVARYFAAFREATGIDRESIETSASTPAELFAECRRKHPNLREYQASMVAINDEMADWQASLSDDDEVLFFPPVAGG